MKKAPQNKDEVLRYLGYKGQDLDETTNILVEESMEEIKDLIHGKYVYKFFNISRNKDNLWLKGSKFELASNDIRKHLAKSEQCILLAATLGHDIDTKIRYYEKLSITKSLILDACATVAIEEMCDRVCEDIKHRLIKEHKGLTTRYSPGYGDFPIEIQNKFLSIIGAEKSIGLAATNSGILIPRKSITAIMGVIDIKDKKEQISCLNCNKYPTCMFSKGDGECGA